MIAKAGAILMNDYPVKFDVPPLNFEILVPNCEPEDVLLYLADARTETLHILPKQFISVNVTGIIKKLPESLTAACPGSNTSPLDALLADYLKGRDTTVYIRGSKQDEHTPRWIAPVLQDTIVPFPLPGHPFDNLIRKFALADVHFNLPDPLAEPDTPRSRPKISALVEVEAALPKEMNFNIDVDQVRADADVFYKGDKLGELDLHKWQQARTTKIKAGLLVEAKVVKAPLNITDDDVFTEVVQQLIFSGKGAELGIKAKVDVNTKTALGNFIVRQIPAAGKVFVKPIAGGSLSGFRPKIGGLEIIETTSKTLTLQARVNITNPTDYSAKVPFVDINLLVNDTVLGHGSAENVSVVPGPNSILVTAIWKPANKTVGRDFLSQYISGYNATITLRTHESSIPSQPSLGKALSKFSIEMPTPQLFSSLPDDGDDDNDGDDDPQSKAPRFIKDATVLHLFHTLSATLA